MTTTALCHICPHFLVAPPSSLVCHPTPLPPLAVRMPRADIFSYPTLPPTLPCQPPPRSSVFGPCTTAPAWWRENVPESRLGERNTPSAASKRAVGVRRSGTSNRGGFICDSASSTSTKNVSSKAAGTKTSVFG
ncbi:hypothetical protein B0H12DRAFT_1107530 [Mycena haematopus]|nr:hypothetical protein B0H12DRAFT_1107530 [Mycena haematopus]